MFFYDKESSLGFKIKNLDAFVYDNVHAELNIYLKHGAHIKHKIYNSPKVCDKINEAIDAYNNNVQIIEELKQKVKELEETISYAPGGTIYNEAQVHFASLSSELPKENK
jgi:hypothetical protein